MKYACLSILILLTPLVSPAAIGPIIGANHVCARSTTTLTDTTSGGTWSSSDTTIAYVNATTGVVLGVSAGNVTITYTVGSGYETKSMIVKQTPSMIMTPSYVPHREFYICNHFGITLTFIDTTSGGWWAVTPASGLTFIPTGGTVLVDLHGMLYSSADVYYHIGTGCPAIVSIVNLGPGAYYPPIAGDSSLFVDSTISLSHVHTSLERYVWSSSNPAVATVGSTTGIVTGISPGNAIISFLAGCYAYKSITVLPPASVPGISANAGGITFMPNPASASLTINSDETINEVAIANLLGQTVRTHRPNARETQLDIAELIPGIYLLTINGTEVRRFVKQ